VRSGAGKKNAEGFFDCASAGSRAARLPKKGSVDAPLRMTSMRWVAQRAGGATAESEHRSLTSIRKRRGLVRDDTTALG